MKLRYTEKGKRDLRLDWLRGYAIFAMSVNHFGWGRDWLSIITGGSAFLFNAAEVFFFVSGLTLGIVSERRPLLSAVSRCYRRAWEIYIWVLFLAIGGSLIGQTEFEPGHSIWAYIGRIATLQWAPFHADVLVAYILYLLAVPGVIILLGKGRHWLVLTGIFMVYGISQLDPEHLSLPFASFRNLAVNSPVFFGAMVLGWHRNSVAEWWHARRWRVLIDGLIVAVGLALLVFYATDYRGWPALGNAMEVCRMGTREFEMPPLALGIVALYMRCLWILVDRLWKVLHTGLGWLVMPFGRDALVAYVLHAFMMPLTERLMEPFELNYEYMRNEILVSLVYVGLIWSGMRLWLWYQRSDEQGRHRLGWLGRHTPELVLVTSGIWLFAAGPVIAPRIDEEEHWRHREVLYDGLIEYDTAIAALLVEDFELWENEPVESLGRLSERLIDIANEERIGWSEPLLVLVPGDRAAKPERLDTAAREFELPIEWTGDWEQIGESDIVVIFSPQGEGLDEQLEAIRRQLENVRTERSDLPAVVVTYRIMEE